MAWTRLFFHSARHIGNCRKQGILRQVLRQRAVVFPYRRQIRFVEKKRCSVFSSFKVFQVGFSHICLGYVFRYDLQYISSFFRRRHSFWKSYSVMDVQASVGLGIRRRLYSVDRSIRFWFLQHYVDFHYSRLYYNASLQASFVVRLLSYGNNDTADLQS